MKILQIVAALDIGGMQRFVLDLAQELGKTQEVVLLTLYDKSHDQLSIDNPTFRRVAFSRHRGLDWKLFQRVFRLIQQEKPDIVHTHMMSLLYASPALFLLGKKTLFVHTIHNVANNEINEIDFLKRRLYGKRVCAVSISREVQISVNRHFGDINTPLIDNGATEPMITAEGEAEVTASLKQAGVSPDLPLMVNLAHLSDSKNQRMLNQAAKNLTQAGFRFAVALVGRDGDVEYSRALRNELSGNVYCMGPSLHPGAWLKRANFFVLPSLYEGLPISLLEAMSLGCVPICTPAGGVKDVVKDNVNGFLTRDFSVDAMTEKLRLALELSDEHRQQISEVCREDFRVHYAMQRCAESYIKLYQKLHGHTER